MRDVASKFCQFVTRAFEFRPAVRNQIPVRTPEGAPLASRDPRNLPVTCRRMSGWIQSPTFDILSNCRPRIFPDGFRGSETDVLTRPPGSANLPESGALSGQEEMPEARNFRQETGAHFNAQAHISTQPASSLKNAWLPLTNEDQGRRSGAEPSPCHGPQARLRQRWLSRLSLPAALFRLEQSQNSILAGISPVSP